MQYSGPGLAKCCAQVGAATQLLMERTYTAAAAGKFVLSLGGDHSIAIGSLAGVLKARPDTGIIWVDAHCDVNTPITSASGNIHGMVLALLMGLVDPRTMPGFDWLTGHRPLRPEQLVYIGIRDVDPPEAAVLREKGIKAYSMYHVDKYGIGKVMEMALDHICGGGDRRPLHLSYDIDACDPGIAPSTGTAVRGGLTFREAHFIAEDIAATGQLGSMDLVEVCN